MGKGDFWETESMERGTQDRTAGSLEQGGRSTGLAGAMAVRRNGTYDHVAEDGSRLKKCVGAGLQVVGLRLRLGLGLVVRLMFWGCGGESFLGLGGLGLGDGSIYGN